MMIIDLAVAFSEGAIPTKTKALDYFQKDTKLLQDEAMSPAKQYLFKKSILFKRDLNEVLLDSFEC